MIPVFNLSVERCIFTFFFFSFSGWAGECLMESIVRKRPVNKGSLRGPYVPVHGIGGFVIYAALAPLKAHPALVYIAGALLCTALEYLAALFLEKVVGKRSWDYATYPFTYWCNFQRRIALTTSLFFGLVALAFVYFYWDVTVRLMDIIGLPALYWLDGALGLGFTLDIIFTYGKCIRNKRAGIPNKTDGL
jgi:uncharacterized membrane protein